MAKGKGLRREILTNRIMILGVFTIAILMMLTVWALFMDLGPRDIYERFTTSQIEYINATTVYIGEPELAILNTRYQSDSKEYIYCLYGSVFEDGYLIEEMSETEVIQASEDQIQYKRCRRTQKYLGTIHSHPQPEKKNLIATCKLSDFDLYTFGSEMSPLTGVICGENKIAFYGVGEFDKSFQIKVVKEQN